jgi:hypothetical protein
MADERGKQLEAKEKEEEKKEEDTNHTNAAPEGADKEEDKQ